MNQTKLESLIEGILNQFSGMIISFGTWVWIVAPVFGIPYQGFVANLGIVCVFTTVSIIRGYVWRRFFNKGLHKKVHSYVMRLKA